MKNKKLLHIIIAAIFLVTATAYYYVGEGKEKYYDTNYYDANGNLLGKCKIYYDQENFLHIEEFYNNQQILVGKETTYQGPGGSGWKGNCEGILCEDYTTDVSSPYYGRKIIKHTCQ